MTTDKQDRAAFEAWFQKQHQGTDLGFCEQGMYLDNLAADSWTAWQASREQALESRYGRISSELREADALVRNYVEALLANNIDAAAEAAKGMVDYVMLPAIAQPENDGLFVGLIAKHAGLADELAQPESEPEGTQNASTPASDREALIADLRWMARHRGYVSVSKAADMLEADAQGPSPWPDDLAQQMVVPHNFISHKEPWLCALKIARDSAEVMPPDIDDKAYWEHEIRAFESAYNELADAQQVAVPPTHQQLAQGAFIPQVTGFGAVPSGYVLVPIEPTPEMVAAYLAANTTYWQRTDELPATNPSKWRQGTPSEATAESYRAMLKAAPQPAAYVPLTDEDIYRAFCSVRAMRGWALSGPQIEFARAIEQAVRGKT